MVPDAAQVAHDLPCVPARVRVEPGGRLVEEQQIRVADQAQCQVQAALLAAGQVPDLLPLLPGQADQVDHLVDVPRAPGSSRRCGRWSRGPSGRARPRCPAAPARSARAAPGRADRSPGSRPSTSTRPASRVRNPSRISRVVVLPAPFGPSSAKISPRRDGEAHPAHGLHRAVTLPQSRHDDRVGGRSAEAAWPVAAGHCVRTDLHVIQGSGRPARGMRVTPNAVRSIRVAARAVNDPDGTADSLDRQADRPGDIARRSAYRSGPGRPGARPQTS